MKLIFTRIVIIIL